MMYKSFDTGEVFTEEELLKDYEDFKSEIVESGSPDNFEDYLDQLLDMGRDGIGGLIEIAS